MGWDFSRASERNPLEMKVPIRWRGFQPISWISARDENPSPLSEIVLGFSAWANRLKNLQEGQFCNWNGISAWAEIRQYAQWVVFLGNKMAYISARAEIPGILLSALFASYFKLKPCLTVFMSILFLLQCFWALLVSEVTANSTFSLVYLLQLLRCYYTWLECITMDDNI